MKTRVYTTILILAFFSFGCKSTKDSTSNLEGNSGLDKLVNSRNFEIEAKLAIPLITNSASEAIVAGSLLPGDNINQITVNKPANFLRVMGDSIALHLPYYGERHMSGDYTARNGIQFKGVPENLEIIKDGEKQSYKLKFTLNYKKEVYRVRADLFPDLSGIVTIYSSARSRIRYQGTIKVLEERIAVTMNN